MLRASAPRHERKCGCASVRSHGQFRHTCPIQTHMCVHVEYTYVYDTHRCAELENKRVLLGSTHTCVRLEHTYVFTYDTLMCSRGTHMCVHLEHNETHAQLKHTCVYPWKHICAHVSKHKCSPKAHTHARTSKTMRFLGHIHVYTWRANRLSDAKNVHLAHTNVFT